MPSNEEIENKWNLIQARLKPRKDALRPRITPEVLALVREIFLVFPHDDHEMIQVINDLENLVDVPRSDHEALHSEIVALHGFDES